MTSSRPRYTPGMILLLTLLLAADAAPFPLEMKAGKSIALCKTGTIICPASAPICDDTSIVSAEAGAEGLIFKALKPGTTLCSAASSEGGGMRRVYRVVVTE